MNIFFYNISHGFLQAHLEFYEETKDIRMESRSWLEYSSSLYETRWRHECKWASWNQVLYRGEELDNVYILLSENEYFKASLVLS